MAVMIGIDPHKASHTAAAIDKTEKVLGELTVRSGANQVERLVGWASQFEERTWAVEGAGGLGYLLAQQLVAAGEHVVDVQPKLAARVRLLSNAATNKNDPNDARSVAIVALRSSSPVAVHAEDHTAVMKVWSKRHRDLASHRTRLACRLHAVLCELVPGGYSGEIYASRAQDCWTSSSRKEPSPLHAMSWRSSCWPTSLASMSKSARPKSASPRRSRRPKQR